MVACSPVNTLVHNATRVQSEEMTALEWALITNKPLSVLTLTGNTGVGDRASSERCSCPECGVQCWKGGKWCPSELDRGQNPGPGCGSWSAKTVNDTLVLGMAAGTKKTHSCVPGGVTGDSKEYLGERNGDKDNSWDSTF